MWTHFVNLVHQAWQAFLQAEGTTGLGWIGDKIVLPCGAFLFAVVVIWSVQGSEAVREHKRKTFEFAFVASFVLFVVWHSSVFIWTGIKTVYGDHRDSSGRWRAVVNEKNTLKGFLQNRDSYIARLQAEVSMKPNVIEKTRFAPEPRNCWVDSVGKYTNPQTRHTVAIVTLHCNYRVDAPLRISLETNRPLANFNYFLPSGEVPIAPIGQVSGTEKGLGVDSSLYIDIQAPSFSAEQMVVIQVESMTTEAPIPLKGSINSK